MADRSGQTHPLQTFQTLQAAEEFAATPEGKSLIGELNTDEAAVKADETAVEAAPDGPAKEADEEKEEQAESKEQADETEAQDDFDASPEGVAPAAKAEENAVAADEHTEDSEATQEDDETADEQGVAAPAAEDADENKDQSDEVADATDEDNTLKAEEKEFDTPEVPPAESATEPWDDTPEGEEAVKEIDQVRTPRLCRPHVHHDSKPGSRPRLAGSSESTESAAVSGPRLETDVPPADA